MKILVFAAKIVGLECIRFLLRCFPDDEYTFVICEPDAEIIIADLISKRVQFSRLDEDVLHHITKKEDDHYDWLLNLWGGYIFKENILSKVAQSVNIHPAYLPYCRGRDPIVWAIRYGYPAGVTLHQINSEVDEGAIWYQEQVDYKFPCTGGELYSEVVDRSWRVFCENWQKIRSNQMPLQQQKSDFEIKTFRRKELWVDRHINLNIDKDAEIVVRRLLAHDFGKAYQAEIEIDGKIYSARLQLDDKPENS